MLSRVEFTYTTLENMLALLLIDKNVTIYFPPLTLIEDIIADSFTDFWEFRKSW